MKAKGERRTAKAHQPAEPARSDHYVADGEARGLGGAGARPQDAPRFLQAVIDAIPEATLVIGRDHRIVLANRTAREVIGGEDPVAGHLTCYQAFHRLDAPCDGQEYPCPLEKVFQTKAEVTVEHRHLNADGGEVVVEVTASPVFNDAGDVIHIVGIIEDITDRKQAEEALRYRADFERLITGLSADMVHLGPDEVDPGIQQALQTIGEFAHVDRSYVFLLREGGLLADNTHEWCAEGIESQTESLKGIPVDDELPWFAEKIRRLEVFHVPDVSALGPEATLEKTHFDSQHIQSLIAVPMVHHGDLFGFLGFDSVHQKKTWFEDAAVLLQRVRELFTHLLARKQAEEENENLARFPSEDPDPVLRVSADGTVMYANAASESLLAAWGSGVGRPVPDVWADRLVWSLDEGQVWQETLAHKGRRFSFSGVPVPAAGYVNLYGRDITDLQRAEDELRQVSSRQEAILAAVPDIIMEVDANKVYTWANRAGLEFFGPDVIGKPADHYFEGQQNTYDVVQPLFGGSEETIYVESWQRRQDGAKRLLAWWCRVLKDPSGHVTGALSTVRDITERKRKEAEREELLHSLRERVKEMGCMFAVARLAHGPAAAAEVCREAVRLIPQGWQYPQITRCRIRLDGREYLSGPFDQTPWRLSAEIVVSGRVRGSVEVYYLQERPERDEGPFLTEERRLIDTIARALGEAIRRKEAEQEAGKLQERIDFILGATNTGIDIIDADFNIRYINPEWQAHCGDPAGRKCYEYFMDRDTVCPGCGVVKALQTRQPAVTQEVLPKEGNRPIQVTTIPFQDENGDWLAAEVNVDISERVRMEEQFHHAQKMEAVGQLAGGVAHDFRNQLTVIRGLAEAMLRRGMVNDDGRDRAERILHAVERSDELTGQLLAFSRKEILEPRVTDLADLVADLGKTLPQMIGEDIRLSITRGLDPCRAHVDPNLLQQAVINLALNARDAMPNGGALIVETAVVDLDEDSAVDMNGAEPGRYGTLQVIDTGEGMDASVRERIFEPFFTTKKAGRGTGLGLSMVYGFVKQSGGYVHCRSAPGEGTRMTLLFPWTDDADVPARTSPPSPPAPPGHQTLLVVEDDPSVREALVESLEEAGYQVLPARSAGEAIALAEKHPRPIHMLIADVIMPDQNGPELAERLRASRPELACLFVSGYAGDELSRRGAENVRQNLLSKPFTHEQLLRRIRRTLGRATPPTTP